MIRSTSYRFSLARRWLMAFLAASLLLWTEASGQAFNDRVQRTDSLFEVGNVDSAMASFAALLQQETEPRDTTLLEALFRIGSRLEGLGRYGDATQAFEMASVVFGVRFGADTSAARRLYEEARDFFQRGYHSRAEAFCRRALELWERTGHPGIIGAHLLLGNIIIQFGLTEETEQHYQQALQVSKELYGNEHYHTARALSGLANIYYNRGRYAEAEPLYRQTLQIYLDTLGEQFRGVTGMLINLGLVLRAQGRYQESENYYSRALRILEAGDPPNPHGTAYALQNLAETFRVQGKYEEAAQRLERALVILEETLGPGNPFTLVPLEMLAGVKLDQDQPSLAADYQKKAVQIADSIIGREHPLTANLLITLGHIRTAEGNLSAAQALYEEALDIHVSSYGQDHNYIADCLEALSTLHRRLGDFQKGAKLAARAVRIRRMLLREFSLVVSERDALISSRAMRHSMNNFLSACMDAKGPSGQSDEAIIDIILAGKGEISDAIFDRRNLLNQPMDSAATDAWQSYRLALYQLSELYVEGPEVADDAGYKNAVDSLSIVVKQREALFAQRLDRYNDHSQQDQVDHAQVAAQLPPKSALVEYMRYVRYPADGTERGTPSYIATTLDSEGKVSLADLGAAGPIDDALQRYRQHFARVSQIGHLPSKDDMAEYETIARNLCAHLWTPIQDEISASDLIFVAPDGPLNQISFAALIDDDRHYLLDRYPIHYLSAGRDLLRLKKSSPPASGLLAVGDPVFATPSAPGGNTMTQIPWVGSVRSSCDELQNLKLSPLPNTRTEVGRVVALWVAETAESFDTLLGANATEDRFKQSAHGKRVIHLSTHGYYLQGVCANNVPEHRAAGEEDFITEDPLLQSGLFFAGCMDPKKEQGATTSKPEDGVLTAAEIAGMDLSGTQLVVLSACETGLGHLYQGEGVYGLRRAFQIAGARTVISTLWPIADELTAPMLPPIYHLSHDPLPNRLRATQLDWIATLRQSGLSDHPYSWGAFIAQGAWR